MTTDADRPPGAGVSEPAVPFATAVRAWFAISLQTFGGPAGQIAVMQRTWSTRSGGSASVGSGTR